MTAGDLLGRLHAVSPYQGFDPSPYPEGMNDWGSPDTVFDDVIAAVRPSVIVEVGSWKGASAIYMAEIARRLDLDTKIVCIDTWLGSPEHSLDRPFAPRAALMPSFGYPQLYYCFLANVVRAGHADRIVPLPTTSENGAVILREIGVRPDLCYIDAAHEFEPALRDFRQYWGLMADRGVLIGDDYWGWPGVTRAAIRFSREIGRPHFGRPAKFVVSAHPAVEVRHRKRGGIRYHAGGNEAPAPDA